MQAGQSSEASARAKARRLLAPAEPRMRLVLVVGILEPLSARVAVSFVDVPCRLVVLLVLLVHGALELVVEDGRDAGTERVQEARPATILLLSTQGRADVSRAGLDQLVEGAKEVSVICSIDGSRKGGRKADGRGDGLMAHDRRERIRGARLLPGESKVRDALVDPAEVDRLLVAVALAGEMLVELLLRRRGVVARLAPEGRRRMAVGQANGAGGLRQIAGGAE